MKDLMSALCSAVGLLLKMIIINGIATLVFIIVCRLNFSAFDNASLHFHITSGLGCESFPKLTCPCRTSSW